MMRALCGRCVCLIASLWLLSGCTQWFFYPTQEWVQTPKQHGYDFESMMLPMHDGVALNLWYMPARTASVKGSILYFHGNAENISTHVNAVYWLTDQGFDLYLLDYRGYGQSQGHVDLAMTLQDIDTVSQWFIKRTNPDLHRVVLGQSLGAAMSGYVMATQPQLSSAMSLVILESGFASYPQVARNALSQFWLTWPMQYPLSWFVSGQFNLDDVIAQLSPTPLLILHGYEDPVVPYKHAQQLIEQAKPPKRLMSYKGGHIAAFTNPDNHRIVVDYIQQQKVPSNR